MGSEQTTYNVMKYLQQGSNYTQGSRQWSCWVHVFFVNNSNRCVQYEILANGINKLHTQNSVISKKLGGYRSKKG